MKKYAAPKLWRLVGTNVLASAHTKSEARARMKRMGTALPPGSVVVMHGEEEYAGRLRGVFVRLVRRTIAAGRSFQAAARAAHVAIDTASRAIA